MKWDEVADNGQDSEKTATVYSDMGFVAANPESCYSCEDMSSGENEMQINDEMRKYLNGELFCNGLHVKLTGQTRRQIPDRFSVLQDLAAGKRAIHIGAADHIPLIDAKIRKGLWLHKHLMDCSEKCVGVDINGEAIDHIQQTYGFEGLYCTDIANSDDLHFLEDQHWDYIFVPEVLEHIGDIGHFLKILHQKLKGSVDHVLVTVPNAMRFKNIKCVFKNVECINSDHRFWFTPFTISKLLTDAGFVMHSVDFAMGKKVSSSIGLRSSVNRYLYRRFPGLRDMLVAIASFS